MQGTHEPETDLPLSADIGHGVRHSRWRWGLLGGITGMALGAGLFLVPPLAVMGPRPAVAEATAAQVADLQASLIAATERVAPGVVSIRTERGLGSGVLYDPSGLVLTNAHVVEGASRISVGLADGRRLAGRLLGADPGFDLAAVKIEGENLPVAPLGDSRDLRVGEFVIAIGNPYGFDHTVTTGVVSALDRPMSEGSDSYNQPMIQTDAAINPGNSGGALVDLDGSVVGINTLVAAPQGFPAQGLGFAVPINTAKRIAPQLVASGRVAHSGQPYLGVSLSDVDPSAPRLARPSPGPQRPPVPAVPSAPDHGALATQVEPDGPAGRAGLRTGDIITSFEGQEVYDAAQLLQKLVLHQPGERVGLGVSRGGQSLTLAPVLGEAAPRDGSRG